MPVLKVIVKTNYGKQMVYPADAESRDLLALMKQKSFSAADMRSLRSMGYTFESVGAALPTDDDPAASLDPAQGPESP